MSSKFKKIAGASALGALSIVEALHLQQASATPVNFSGPSVANQRGGSVQVSITVDGGSGTYKITGISTPVQPTGQNAAYANFAIPTLTNEALAAQSASINGVSGASEISAAWKASLSGAIAAASAAGEAVGTSSLPPVVATPTPTPVASVPASTPPAGGTPTSNPVGPTSSPLPVSTAIPTSVGTPPTFYPLYMPPYVAAPSSNTGNTTTASLSSYIAQLSNAISLLPNKVSSNNASTALSNAKSALAALQSKIQSDASQPQTPASSSNSTAETAYIANLNASAQYTIQQANTAITDYYTKVQNAANQLYTDAQTSSTQVLTDAQAKADQTLTDAQVKADKIVADAQAKADAIKAAAAPKPSPSLVSPPLNLKPGGVIKKSYTCVKTVGKITTKKVMTGIIVKCPTGFKLLKKP